MRSSLLSTTERERAKETETKRRDRETERERAIEREREKERVCVRVEVVFEDQLEDLLGVSLAGSQCLEVFKRGSVFDPDPTLFVGSLCLQATLCLWRSPCTIWLIKYFAMST